MSREITLTNPLQAPELQAASPLARTMDTGELAELIPILEHALRDNYNVFRTDDAASKVVRRAMIAAFPSFVNQYRQVASETIGTGNVTVTYNRSGVIDFEWPRMIAFILRGYADDGGSNPHTTQLVRE